MSSWYLYIVEAKTIARLQEMGCKKNDFITENKKQRHHFADKGVYSHSYGFSSSYIWM